MSDPEDLEDGEIEDDEDDEVQPIDPPLAQPSPSDYKEDVEKPTQPDNDRRGGDRLQSPGPSHGPTRDHHSPASGAKPNQGRSKPGPVVDDWGAKVESAIANALKKDGVQPPMPSAAIGHNDEEDMPGGGGGHAGSGGGGISSSRKSRKRKKASRAGGSGGGGGGGGGGSAGGGDHQPSSKHQRLDDGEPDGEERGEMDLEYEMLNMRGGSPQAGGAPEVLVSADSEADTQYSSDGSSSVRRGDRDRARDRERERNRERDREQRVADREREREREYNRNKRKQQKQQGRQRSRKEAGRDSRKRKRDDSDDEKYRPTGPRKMELCKFYLMDCCAKREKCLYMHKDFPCKYYYLGMKCKEREKCHFSHGEPLTNDLRLILLKHLETAPQEILGDFQRINRETAIGLLNTTHRKLLERYGRQDPASDGGGGGDVKIPSLLDSLSSPHGVGNSRQHRSKNSRWRERPDHEDPTTPDREEDDVKAHDGEPLSLHHLTSVITATQINDLEQMGIRTLDEISQLTVAQLNDLGLSITQIHDLQVKALSVKKFRNAGGQAPSGGMDREGDRSSLDRSLGTAGAKDLDMRILPGLEVPPKTVESATSEHVTGAGGNKDVDMRILPPIDRLESQSESQAEDSSATSKPLIPPSLLLKPPTVDYSQYIKDSNLDEDDLNATDTGCLISNDPEDEDDEDDDDDDDENHLKINIEEDEEDAKKELEDENEDGQKQRDGAQAANEESGMLLPPLVPPKIDYAQGLGDFLLYGSLDKSAAKKVSPPRSESSPVTASSKDENGSTLTDLNADEVWTPSMSLDSDRSTTIAPAPAPKPKPTARAPINKRRITSGPPSIYDRDDSDSVSSPDGPRSPVSGGLAYGRSDRPLPLDLNDDEASEYGADGLRSRNLGFPFKPMMGNYVPATEIDGSIGSHATIQYKVYVVDIPKPNFKALRRSMQRPMGTRDPRLRRLFGLHSDEEDAKDSHDDGDSTEGIKSPDASSISSPLYGVPPHPASLPPAPHSSMPPQIVPSAPRVDPRKRHAEAKQLAQQQQQQQSDGGTAPFGNLPPPIPNSAPTTQMDVQTILQKSAWYKELGTKHKIMVNQQLAILSTEMKKYHSSDRSTERLSEFMKFLGTNSMLQHILTCLNVYVDHTVAFCEVAVVPNLPPPSFLPNVPPPSLAVGGTAVPVHFPPPINVQPLLNVPPPSAMSGGPPPPYLNINGSPGGGNGNNPPRFGPPMPAEPGSNALPPGLLGIAPNMPFEQFLAMGNINNKGGPDHGGGGGNIIPPWTQGNPNNNSMRNMRNNNRIGQNFRNNNDRWNNNGGGGGGGPGMMGGGQGNNGNNRRNNNRRMDRKK
ncbi:protein suppressor of sable [Anopheles cruzii]|uniref:protein suppressor of sable n=1 Tax=Anopheles cruzii TaxID=68878 RepID=UPI0022EC8DFE|nr:protein suppressor of sable [Anopheles cruzii]